MKKRIKPSEARQRKPDFFEKRPADVNWTLSVTEPDGKQHQFVGCDWEAKSRFGKVENAVIVGNDGMPQFDRPAYYEAPNVNVVAWGRDTRTGEVKVAIITEERPHAIHPEMPEADVTLKFAQIPMGFLEKLIGKDQLSQLEFKRFGALREVTEETGASAIRGFSRPACPWHNPSPSFVATWSDLYFIEVDLEKIGELKLDKNEPIFKAEYLPVRELLARIREGQSADGAIFRACTSLSLLMIFFACYPEFWPK